MSHTIIIVDFVGPIFADPRVRETLDKETCTMVDAILQKDVLTRRDKRCLARALEDWITHEDDEG
jgi:hypothetical protein